MSSPNDLRPRLIVHAGMGKAGSTTIQKHVLTSFGAPPTISRWCVRSDERETVGPAGFWWRQLCSGDPGVAAPAFDRLKRQLSESKDPIVLSDEVLSASTNHLENFARNTAALPVPVEFLLIVRRQERYLQSLYNHGERSKVSALGLPRLHTELLDRVRYLSDIDAWCEDLLTASALGEQNVIRILHYDNVVRMLKQANRDCKVTLVPLELLHHAPTQFYSALASVFNIAPAEIVKAFSNRENVTGKRLRDYPFGLFAERLLRIRLLAAIRRKLGVSSTAARRALVRGLATISSPRIDKVSEATEERLRTAFGRSNSKLAQMTGYDLSTLGYSMKDSAG
jgi:hypothetical protein